MASLLLEMLRGMPCLPRALLPAADQALLPAPDCLPPHLIAHDVGHIQRVPHKLGRRRRLLFNRQPLVCWRQRIQRLLSWAQAAGVPARGPRDVGDVQRVGPRAGALPREPSRLHARVRRRLRQQGAQECVGLACRRQNAGLTPGGKICPAMQQPICEFHLRHVQSCANQASGLGPGNVGDG